MNEFLHQLWQALKEAETSYDYSLIFNYLMEKEIDGNED